MIYKHILGHSLSLKNGAKTNPETATKGVLQKKVFLKISQNSKENENTYARVSFVVGHLWVTVSACVKV